MTQQESKSNQGLCIEKQSSKLSIEQCQKVLKKNGVVLTDEQVEQVRDFLYLLAEIEYEHYKKEKEDAAKDSTVSENNIEENHLPET